MKNTTRIMLSSTMLAGGLLFASQETASAHCDTHDGPVVHDAQQAIAEDNVNYIAKWVSPENEAELKQAFEDTMTVRDDSPEAQALADEYLYQNLVRIHRAGEGAAYTGIKPEGTPPAPEVAAADASIEAESLAPFEGVLAEEEIASLEASFDKVLAAKSFDANDVAAGREYVAAYVEFNHSAEAKGEGAHAESGEAAHGEGTAHTEEAAHTEDTTQAQTADTPNETQEETGFLAWLKSIFSN